MKLLEYQAKEQFAGAGIPVNEGRLARTVEQVVDAAKLLGPIAVKAQVPIGGRGKAGGIKLAKSPEEAKAAAEAILGHAHLRGAGPHTHCALAHARAGHRDCADRSLAEHLR